MARRPFFSGNYGSALGSTANAANLIAQAGATQGQMYANLGAQIGNMIQQYGLNKEKRDKAEAAFRGDMARLIKSNPQAVTQMQQDPTIGPALKKIEEGNGTQKHFDAYNAYRAADREAMIQGMQIDNLKLRQEQERLRNQILREEANYAGEVVRSNIANVDARTRSMQNQEKMIPLQMDNIRSQIKSREIATAQAFMNALGISGKAPTDLDKRFSEINTQLDKIDESKIKARVSGLFGGEEKEITFGEFRENPGSYAPMTSERIKALQAYRDRLIQDQTQMMFNEKFPTIDPETGETLFVTFRQIMEYNEARKKLAEEERRKQASEQANEMELGRNVLLGPGAGLKY